MNNHHPRPNYWKMKDLSTYKYVDDFLSCEGCWLGNGYKIYGQSKQETIIHAQQCEEMFKTVQLNARSIGMSVNERKTQLLCVTSTTGTKVHSYKRLADGSRITSHKELKQLGFFFSAQPTAELHLEKTSEKFRGCLWFLRHLKKASVSTKDLLHVYKCFLLPILDYASVVYHSIITKEQSDSLERLQAAALKIIFEWKKSYVELLMDNELEYVI